MASADPPTPPGGRSGAEVLDVLAEAVLQRLDQVLAERAESLNARADSPELGWLRVSEVARLVGASERTVYRALRSGALVGERLGAHWRIRPESVEAWLANPRPPPTNAISRPGRPTGTRREAGVAPSTYMTRARGRQQPRDVPGWPATNRRIAAPPKEQQ